MDVTCFVVEAKRVSGDSVRTTVNAEREHGMQGRGHLETKVAICCYARLASVTRRSVKDGGWSRLGGGSRREGTTLKFVYAGRGGAGPQSTCYSCTTLRT